MRSNRMISSIAMGGSPERNQWAGEDPGDEAASFAAPARELAGRQERVVDRPGQLGFGPGDGRVEGRLLHGADDQEIDIAARAGRARRLAAVDGGQGDVRLEGELRAAEDLRQTDGFHDQAAQLGEDRTGAVRAVVGLAGQEARIDQSLEFALDRALAGLDLARDLPTGPRLIAKSASRMA
jgi:hypothetical protein